MGLPGQPGPGDPLRALRDDHPGGLRRRRRIDRGPGRGGPRLVPARDAEDVARAPDAPGPLPTRRDPGARRDVEAEPGADPDAPRRQARGLIAPGHRRHGHADGGPAHGRLADLAPDAPRADRRAARGRRRAAPRHGPALRPPRGARPGLRPGAAGRPRRDRPRLAPRPGGAGAGRSRSCPGSRRGSPSAARNASPSSRPRSSSAPRSGPPSSPPWSTTRRWRSRKGG